MPRLMSNVTELCLPNKVIFVWTLNTVMKVRLDRSVFLHSDDLCGSCDDLF